MLLYLKVMMKKSMASVALKKMKSEKIAQGNTFGKLISYLALALLFSMTLVSCKGVLNSQRRAQNMGQIESARVLMDDIARLFFVMPNLAVFAVDFQEGFIYFPPAGAPTRVPVAQADLEKHPTWPKIRIAADEIDAKTIEGLVEAHTGRRVRLEADDLLIMAYQEPVDIGKTLTRLGQEYGIPADEPAEARGQRKNSKQDPKALAGMSRSAPEPN